MKKKTIEDCINLANNKQGRYLSTEYINAITKYLWKCNNDKHPAFYQTYNDVQQGSWCKLCYYESVSKRMTGTHFKHTEESKRQISETLKKNDMGQYMQGRKLKKESIEKRTKTRQENTKKRGYYCPEESLKRGALLRSGENHPMNGMHHTNEIKKKIGEGVKKAYQTERVRNNVKLSFQNPNRIISCRKAALKAQDKLKDRGFSNTKPELKMIEILTKLNMDFIHPYSVWNIEHMYSADFFIPNLNLIIEVDGKYWHNYPNLREIDLIRNQELKNKGYNVLRFWDGEFSQEIVLKNINNFNYNTLKLAA